MTPMDPRPIAFMATYDCTDININILCAHVLSHVQLFCKIINCSLPGCSVDGIFQARTLEWVAISFSNDESEK